MIWFLLCILLVAGMAVLVAPFMGREGCEPENPMPTRRDCHTCGRCPIKGCEPEPECEGCHPIDWNTFSEWIPRGDGP